MPTIFRDPLEVPPASVLGIQNLMTLRVRRGVAIVWVK